MASFGEASKRKPGKLDMAVPPGPDETKGVLREPEHAPSAAPPVAQIARVPVAQGSVGALQPDHATAERRVRPDKKTNRSVQIVTRFTPEFNRRLRALAKRDGLLLCEVIEKALVLYEKSSTTEGALL